MLQIDHVYEFLYQELFEDFEFWYHPKGVITAETIDDINFKSVSVFTPDTVIEKKIFFYDQEPLSSNIYKSYLDVFNWANKYTPDELIRLNTDDNLPFNIPKIADSEVKYLIDNPDCIYKEGILVTSEYCSKVKEYLLEKQIKELTS